MSDNKTDPYVSPELRRLVKACWDAAPETIRPDARCINISDALQLEREVERLNRHNQELAGRISLKHGENDQLRAELKEKTRQLTEIREAHKGTAQLLADKARAKLDGFDIAIGHVRYWRDCHKDRLRTWPDDEIIKCEIRDITELLASLESIRAATEAAREGGK